MAFKRFTVFSRKMLLLLLLVMSRSDSSVPPGRARILDPGVSLPLCFSAQSGGRVLPDPRLFLSAVTCLELSESLYDLSKSFVLSVCLLGFLKIFYGYLIITSQKDDNKRPMYKGGGPESDDEDMTDPFNGKRFTVCMFLPMEIVTLSERVKVVEVGKLVEIPSESQVRQAISKLYKQKEEHPDKFSYIKFHFVMIDYDGLKMLQKYHRYTALQKKVAEEKAWLKQAAQKGEGLGINIDKIDQHFKDNVWSTASFNPMTSIRNLVGKRWLTDDVIESVFDTINMKHDDTICFVCKPTRVMYSSVRLNEKVRNVRENGITKVIVALNVGCDDTGTCHVSDEKRRGAHWALLVIDLKNGVTYYGDSLGWPLPSNLINTVGSNLKRMEGDLGINIMPALNKIVIINKLSCDTSNDSESGRWFYPLQTCSDVCGVIVVCMCAVLCDHWDLWLTCGNEMEAVHVPLLSKPSINSRQLRLIVMSWIVNDSVNTSNLVPIIKKNSTSEGQSKTDTQSTTNSQATKSHDKTVDNPLTHVHADSDDDFVPTSFKRASKHPSTLLKDSDSEDELIKSEKVGKPLILSMLPEGYTYKMISVTHFKDLDSFNCELKIKLETEESVRKWVAEYNEKSKETMVYECCKNQSGKRVVKKLYLRCQHKQRQTGKHTKSNKPLKTTHKQHNNKNTECPAQIIVTLLPPCTRDGFCVAMTLKHTHNHLVDVADALRFRPVSENTKEKYYDLFRQGHSPSSAHLEYETQLTYKDTQLLADRHVNPKISDIYNLFNKWRKSNLGVRTGKQLFTELEHRANVYNDSNNHIGGKAIVHRFCKGSKIKDTADKEVEQPLILAICTPLMSRVHKHIHQSKELVFVDASSSFEDFNNPLFVMSTSSAAGGLPLGIVITSAESADVIHKGMTTLKEFFPESAFYGNSYPENIMIDNSSAEREGLHQTWSSSNIFICTFHFLQSMWRWLLCSKNSIHKDERQYLMNLVRKLVYAKKETELNTEYQQFKSNTVAKQYPNFMAHMEGYWKRRNDWAICFRNGETMRGINTNNYAESGIRILKDIVFNRVKAYNLVQLFDFLTVTFELYYERRLLAVAHNRMDRYISLKYKGLGVAKINQESIRQSTTAGHVYLVKSTVYADKEYEIDTQKWTCTCTVGRTGYPSGEPCKHQHAVANKLNVTAPNLLPYFNADGRYLHALIAVGPHRVGEKNFYAGMKETTSSNIQASTCNPTDSVEMADNTSNNTMDCDTMGDQTTSFDEGEQNLDLILNAMDEQDKLKQDVLTLGNAFIEDVQDRMGQMDIQYLTGLKKFFTVYMDTVKNTEPAVSATPKLSSLLHTYFSQSSSSTAQVHVAGTRRMHVQPTAISRRREGVPKGSKMAPTGRPPKRPLTDCDINVQTKRGRPDHIKRKQNLRLNEQLNQTNHHKHGKGH